MSDMSSVTAAGIVPVVVLEDAAHATPLGEALREGGIPVAEVTFRTSAAPEAIEAMANINDLLVGAGTVTSPEQVNIAVDAGARFIVSPGLSIPVVERALELGVGIFPGAVTPSEIMTALSLGLETVKFFPADVYGGPKALKALGAPFRNTKFIPTGGVRLDNLAEFLSLPNVIAVGGTWITKTDLIHSGDFTMITQLAQEASQLAATIRKDSDV